MKGFIVDNISVEVSDEKADKVDITLPSDSHTKYIDGRRYKDAVAKIEFTSTGDVSEIESEDLLRALKKKIDNIIEIQDNE